MVVHICSMFYIVVKNKLGAKRSTKSMQHIDLCMRMRVSPELLGETLFVGEIARR